MKLSEIRIRDPFIYPDPLTHTYYLFGSVGFEAYKFIVYSSADLVDFSEPKVIFEKNPGFWADRDFWAPEMHCIDGKYYLFASFFSDERLRRSAILVCDTPDGHYEPYLDSLTPEGWHCLDATYFEDDSGQRWSVFCHEWVQTTDGEMCAVKLGRDLRPVSEPKLLFRASEAPWAKSIRAETGTYVTDGPFIVRSGGKYVMLWSSLSESGYTLGQASADAIDGVWTQKGPLFTADGGHGMLFRDFSGNTKLILHVPNSKTEHAEIFDAVLADGAVSLLSHV